MTALFGEVRHIQNPALGAGLLWRFVFGFQDSHPKRASVNLPLLFLPIPLIYQDEICEMIDSTNRNSGLRAFADKFGDSSHRKNDFLMSFHDRVNQWRGQTLESLQLALSTRLLALDHDGTVFDGLKRKSNPQEVMGEAKLMLRASEKLGRWCSALSIHEIGSILYVRF